MKLTSYKGAYSRLVNVEFEALRIDEADFNTQRMLELMAANEGDEPMPLYMHTVLRTLRDLLIEQQKSKTGFNYRAFRSRLLNANLTTAQIEPLKQRLSTLESFMPKYQVGVNAWGRMGKETSEKRNSAWDPVVSNRIPIAAHRRFSDYISLVG